MSISLALLQLVAAVATAATATYLIVESREKRQFLSTKAEELYTAVETVDRSLVEFFGQAYALICEGRALRPSTDYAWSLLQQEQAKVHMLVSFYFPTLWTELKRGDAGVATAMAALVEFEQRHPEESALLALDHLVHDMKDALEALKHAVVLAHRDGRGHAHGLRRLIVTPELRRALRMAA
jgi:mannose-1-phosphate guanylyltransferase